MAKRGRKPKNPPSHQDATPATPPPAKPDGESISGYFRKVFAENPGLLKSRSNDEILLRWQADHPGEELTSRIKQNLSNIKSVLRKKGRKKAKRGKALASPAGVEAVVVVTSRPRTSALEALEEAIDDCLTEARKLDREGLDGVIKLLRRARNEVVWQLGQ